MAGQEKYLIWIFPVVADRLVQRFPAVPLKEILEIVRAQLSTRAKDGRQAPFPFAPGVLLLTLDENTTQGKYRITPVYEISKNDSAVDVLDVGIVQVEDET